MTPTIRLRGPADIIAVLPYHLGYRPSDSLVVVCLDGKRLSMVGRLDLPPPGCDPQVVVVELLPHLVREAPSRVVVLGYESEPGRAEPVSAAMRDALLDEGIAVVDRLVVRGSRFWSLDCTGSCCPADGEPVPADEDVPAVADYVLMGRRPAPCRGDLDRRLKPDELDLATLDRCARLLTEFGAASRKGGRALLAARRAALRDWGELLEGSHDDTVPARQFSGEAWSRMAVSLVDVHLRDLVIAWICPGTLDMEAVDPSLAEIAGTLLPPREEDSKRAPKDSVQADDRLVHSLAELCRRSPAALSPGPLTVLASFTWWLGDGAMTRVALERALAVDPEYRLALLLGRMLDLAIRPHHAA